MAKSLNAQEGMRDIRMSITRARRRRHQLEIEKMKTSMTKATANFKNLSDAALSASTTTAGSLSEAFSRMGKNINDWQREYERYHKPKDE